MKTEYIYSIISSILVILVIISIIIFILSKVPNQVEFDRQTQLTYDKCCNGNMCSDTYYSEKDNLCHLSLCEIPYRPNKKYCVYEPND